MEMDSVDYRIIRKFKKNPVAKYDLQWGWSPGHLPFQPCMFLFELISHLLASLRHLDHNIVMLY